MILIGMFDSPYVRRVAISLDLLGVAFEHRDWSVGRDFERIREFNPLGRVPTLVLDSGEALIESATILDWLDESVGPGRALLPAHGDARREAQSFLALATGAIDKGIQVMMERIFRPAEKRHQPWVDRCTLQAESALGALESRVAGWRDRAWLSGDRPGQMDITLSCFGTYLREAVGMDFSRWPALAGRIAATEALAPFAKYRVPFVAPVPAAVRAESA
jgi:glutathione S-transferase